MAKEKKTKTSGNDGSTPITITRSFSRKLNMAAHGGKQYETADIFCSVTQTTVPGESFGNLSKELDRICQEEVNATIEAFTSEEKEVEEAEEVKPTKKKKNLDLGIKIEQDEFADIQDLINDLTMAKTPADLKKAVIKIKELSSELSKVQKEYLSAYYTKRKEAVTESDEE